MYDQAIAIDPKYVLAYNNKGLIIKLFKQKGNSLYN